ncbi:MAG: Uma2 family endonuclease [Gemmatimonadota bacterium]
MATKPMRILSADDVLRIPVPDHLSGYELVDGELVAVMPVGNDHGRIVVELVSRLHNFVKERGVPGRVYAEAGFVLGLRRDPERVRGPDVSFVTAETLARIDVRPNAFLRVAPDLAIEVESNERPRIQQRVHDYMEAGTRLLWVIQSASRSAIVYRADGSAQLLRESDELDGEDVLPGLRIALPDLLES